MKQIFERTNSAVLAVLALFIFLANANAEHDWTDQIAAYKSPRTAMSPAAALLTSKLTSTTVVLQKHAFSTTIRHTTSGFIRLILPKLNLNSKPLNSANGIPSLLAMNSYSLVTMKKRSIQSNSEELRTSMLTKGTDIPVTFTPRLTGPAAQVEVPCGIPKAKLSLFMHAAQIPPVLNCRSTISTMRLS